MCGCQPGTVTVYSGPGSSFASPRNTGGASLPSDGSLYPFAATGGSQRPSVVIVPVMGVTTRVEVGICSMATWVSAQSPTASVAAGVALTGGVALGGSEGVGLGVVVNVGVRLGVKLG